MAIKGSVTSTTKNLPDHRASTTRPLMPEDRGNLTSSTGARAVEDSPALTNINVIASEQPKCQGSRVVRLQLCQYGSAALRSGL